MNNTATIDKKYELTDECIEVKGCKLYRIKALRTFGKVKAGDLGGFVEAEKNLSHCNNAWVYVGAKVYDNACVSDNAKVFGNAEVYGNAWIFENAKVFGNARVADNATVSGNAEVSDNAIVFGYTAVTDNASVLGNAKVLGNARVVDNALVSSNADYTTVSGFGRIARTTTFSRDINGNIAVACGCFSGTIDEFRAKVKDTHGESKYAKEYLAIADLMEMHFKEES